MRPPGPRLPFAALERLMAVRLGVRAEYGGAQAGWRDDDLAAALGVSLVALRKHRIRDLSLDVADQLAIRAGWHPAEVWPDWWELTAAVDAERTERTEAERKRRQAKRRVRTERERIERQQRREVA